MAAVRKTLTRHIAAFLSQLTGDPAEVTMRQIKEACEPHFGAEWGAVLGAHKDFFKGEAVRLLEKLQAGESLEDVAHEDGKGKAGKKGEDRAERRTLDESSAKEQTKVKKEKQEKKEKKEKKRSSSERDRGSEEEEEEEEEEEAEEGGDENAEGNGKKARRESGAPTMQKEAAAKPARTDSKEVARLKRVAKSIGVPIPPIFFVGYPSNEDLAKRLQDFLMQQGFSSTEFLKGEEMKIRKKVQLAFELDGIDTTNILKTSGPGRRGQESEQKNRYSFSDQESSDNNGGGGRSSKVQRKRSSSDEGEENKGSKSYSFAADGSSDDEVKGAKGGGASRSRRKREEPPSPPEESKGSKSYSFAADDGSSDEEVKGSKVEEGNGSKVEAGDSEKGAEAPAVRRRIVSSDDESD